MHWRIMLGEKGKLPLSNEPPGLDELLAPPRLPLSRPDTRRRWTIAHQIGHLPYRSGTPHGDHRRSFPTVAAANPAGYVDGR
ncbi:hypothetical protein EP51_43410 (plasmid) [Rhodococcus opacus]|uniref:Uncharacterized protein n=1 Tax=Rhodococcus opacus TaxID=37919 RepID=A0A076EYV5_RHOOP|nr:hypothetical protein [Rhodococcus opacus]AII10966.1 hypothetical protein EP51_43410 [Rhodococcus opacus]